MHHDLDANATSAVSPEAYAAWCAAHARFATPADVDTPAGQAFLAQARQDVAQALGAAGFRTVFTDGGTAADRLMLAAVGHLHAPRPHVAVSALEHAAIRDAVAEAQAAGRLLATTLAANASGVVAPPALALAPAIDGVQLITVMLAHNETGALQPIRAWSDCAHAHGALMHTDAVQAVGRVPVDANALGVDALSLASHKVGAVGGIGALLVRADGPLPAALETLAPHRAEENLPGIASLVAALARLPDDAARARVARLRDRLEAQLQAQLGPARCRILAADVPRLGNTSCVHFFGVEAEGLLMALDVAGFAVSAGAACASGALEPSPSLLAMGLSRKQARCVLRISLPHNVTEATLDAFVPTLLSIVQRG